jgi:hypothetical protein
VGASPRSASPDLALPDNRGRQSTKGYPSSGGVVEPSHSGNLRPRLIGYSGSRRDENAPVTLPRKNRIRLRSSIGGRCREWLRWWRGNPRTRSPLPRLPRLRGSFIHDIGLRSGASGSSRLRSPVDFPVCGLDFLITICHGGFRWYRCWSLVRPWLSTQAELLRQGGSTLGVGRGRQGMIGLQSPTSQVFIPVQTMSAADVAA